MGSGKPIEISVPGRYDPVSDGTVVYKRNSAGDEAQVHGYFTPKSNRRQTVSFCV